MSTELLTLLLLVFLGAMPGCNRPSSRSQSLFVEEAAPKNGNATAASTNANKKQAAQVDSDSLAEDNSESPDQMLAAVFLRPGEAWFLKMSGPREAISVNAEGFEKLAKSFTFGKAGSQDSHPLWELPPGWQEKPASGMRWATIVPVNSSEAHQISLIRLPREGNDAAEYLLANVNRWRGQLGLEEWTKEELLQAVGDNAIEDNTAHFFQLQGKLIPDATLMQGPTTNESTTNESINGANPLAENAPLSDALRGADSLNAQGLATPHGSTPPNGLIAAQGAAAANRLSFTAPSHWTVMPASGMRSAVFRVPASASHNGDANAPQPTEEANTQRVEPDSDKPSQGPRDAEATIIPLPKEAGDIPAVINMWRLHAGMSELPGAEAMALGKNIETKSGKGALAEILPVEENTESDGKIGILGAIIPQGDEVWFVKLTGPAALVKSEREHFKTFVETLEIRPRAE